MKETSGQRLYGALRRYADKEKDVSLGEDLAAARFGYYLRNPEVAYKHIPSFIESMRQSMRTAETCQMEQSARAWQIIEKALAPHKEFIEAWNGVALLYGSVSYDVPNQKDIDLAIFTERDAIPDRLQNRVDNAMYDVAQDSGVSIDFAFWALEEWCGFVNNPQSLSDPDIAQRLYISSVLITPLLYGIPLFGSLSNLSKLRSIFLGTIMAHPHIAGLVANNLAFTLHGVRMRKNNR